MARKFSRCTNGRNAKPRAPPALPRGQIKIDGFIEGVYKRDCPGYSLSHCRLKVRGLTSWCRECPHNQSTVKRPPRPKVVKPALDYIQARKKSKTKSRGKRVTIRKQRVSIAEWNEAADAD